MGKHSKVITKKMLCMEDWDWATMTMPLFPNH